MARWIGQAAVVDLASLFGSGVWFLETQLPALLFTDLWQSLKRDPVAKVARPLCRTRDSRTTRAGPLPRWSKP